MLVVAAPAESEPTTPLSAHSASSYAQPWAEDDAEGDDKAVDPLPLGKSETASATTSGLVLHDQPSPSDDQAGPELGEEEDEGFSAWAGDTEEAADDSPDIATTSEGITP